MLYWAPYIYLAMNIRLLQKTILFLLLTYFVIGVTDRLTMGSEEKMYFVTSWSLYSKVPLRDQREYSALIHEIAGERVIPPAAIDDMQGIVFSRMQDYHHTLVHDVQLLAQLLQTGADGQAVRNVRESLEGKFARTPVTYEIVELRYNPIERWLTGKASTTSFGMFTSGLYE